MTRQADRNAERQDPQGLGPKDESGGPATQDAPNALVTPSLLSDSREAMRAALNEALIKQENDRTLWTPEWQIWATQARDALNQPAAILAISLPQTGVEEDAALIEQAGLDAADTIERHLTSPDAIWGLPELPDEWMTALRSITVAALETEIPKLLAALTPKVIDRDIEGETIERCAKVAEAHRDRFGLDSAGSWDRGNAEAGDEIASSIRALASPSLHGDGK